MTSQNSIRFSGVIPGCRKPARPSIITPKLWVGKTVFNILCLTPANSGLYLVLDEPTHLLRKREALMAVDKFPIEAGHIMMFARSIGDANPIYYDEDYAQCTEPGAVVAPPTFVQASAQFDPDYFLRPKIGQEWFGSAKGPTGLTPKEGGSSGGGSGGGLHAEQHYVYHKPLLAGDTLTATVKPGKSWEKEGRRGGKLMFSESVTEYRDLAGELVVTATSVGVRTERPATS
jgi:acyl dehydratase